MPPDGFKRLFWGFLFIFLDVRLCSLDVLPDVVGHVLLFLGLGVLRPVHPRFREAWVCAGVLIFFALVDLIPAVPVTAQNAGLTWAANPVSLPGIIHSILELILVWHLCGGIRDLALSFDQPQLARVAVGRRNLCVALTAAGWLVPLAGLYSPALVLLLVVVLAVCAVVVMCLLMGLMLRASRELQPEIEAGAMTARTRVWTGVVLVAACGALFGLCLFPQRLGLAGIPLSFAPWQVVAVGTTGLNASSEELNGGRLHHLRIGNRRAAARSCYVLELAPPLPASGSGSGGGSGGATAYAYEYRTVHIDGPSEQHGLHFDYSKPDHTLSIRESSRKAGALAPLFPSRGPRAGAGNRFDLAEGNLFVVRLNDHGEIEAVEQLKAHHQPGAGLPLATFQRLLPDRPEVQAVGPKEQ